MSDHKVATGLKCVIKHRGLVGSTVDSYSEGHVFTSWYWLS
jgi:hypothetical protein